MRKAQSISFPVLLLAVAVMVVNRLAAPLPDGVVRTAGVVLLLSLASLAYCTVKRSMEK